MYKNKPHLFFILLIAFIIVLKLPGIFTDDIQPWDEGMYAQRVNSISTFGDFFDQSSHSIEHFYSGSHPPLLIWTGYLFTSILGDHAYVFKLVVFIFGILCLLMIYLTGIELYYLISKADKVKDQKLPALFGSLGAMIFSGNIIFHVFSQRFQFDVPYTFFIVTAFYFFILYLKDKKMKHLYFTGILFGLCLMVKILVGIFIPIVIFLFYILSRDRLRFKDVAIITGIGILIAAPWHIYMVVKYGNEFIEYFFNYHIYKRATEGVDQNTKNSGPLFHINYFLTIIPFGVILAIKLFYDLRNFKKLNIYTKFLDIWFLTGLTILTLFRTKLESYTFLILLPACFIIPSLILFDSDFLSKNKKYLSALLAINLVWYSTEYYRDAGRMFILGNTVNLILLVGLLLIITAIIYFIYLYAIKKLEPGKFLVSLISLTFIISGLSYLINKPKWENSFILSGIKNEILVKNIKKIVYIGLKKDRNPQFSYYFSGIDQGWNKSDIKYSYVNGNSNADSIRSVVSSVESNSAILIEKDGINRGTYIDSKLFMGEEKPAITAPGYELYIKK